MALVGAASGLSTGTVVPALPEAGDLTRLRVREEAGHVDDLRISWRSQRHFDHLDPEKGGIGILIRVQSRTSRHFSSRTYGAGTGVVDVDVGGVVGVRNQRMGVGPAAGLDRRDLPRIVQIAQIEDANPSKTLRTHRVGHALEAAIEPAARLLGRHEDQVPYTETSPCPPGHTTESLNSGAVGSEMS